MININDRYFTLVHRYIYWVYSFLSGIKETLDQIPLGDIPSLDATSMESLFLDIWSRADEKYTSSALSAFCHLQEEVSNTLTELQKKEKKEHAQGRRTKSDSTGN
jgi:hypothetical protein